MWLPPDVHSENRTKIQILGFHSGAAIKISTLAHFNQRYSGLWLIVGIRDFVKSRPLHTRF